MEGHTENEIEAIKSQIVSKINKDNENMMRIAFVGPSASGKAAVIRFYQNELKKGTAKTEKEIPKTVSPTKPLSPIATFFTISNRLTLVHACDLDVRRCFVPKYWQLLIEQLDEGVVANRRRYDLCDPHASDPTRRVNQCVFVLDAADATKRGWTCTYLDEQCLRNVARVLWTIESKMGTPPWLIVQNASHLSSSTYEWTRTQLGIGHRAIFVDAAMSENRDFQYQLLRLLNAVLDGQ